MKKFRVKFWYATDLRATEVVEAGNEVTALVLALHQIHVHEWVDQKEFRVEIELVG